MIFYIRCDILHNAKSPFINWKKSRGKSFENCRRTFSYLLSSLTLLNYQKTQFLYTLFLLSSSTTIKAKLDEWHLNHQVGFNHPIIIGRSLGHEHDPQLSMTSIDLGRAKMIMSNHILLIEAWKNYTPHVPFINEKRIRRELARLKKIVVVIRINMADNCT